MWENSGRKLCVGASVIPVASLPKPMAEPDGHVVGEEIPMPTEEPPSEDVLA